jgi:hypothetical protein
MVDGAQAVGRAPPSHCQVARGLLRLCLDGLARVGELAGMQVFSDEVGPPGRLLSVNSLCVQNFFWQREAELYCSPNTRRQSPYV